jgi:hypothetical protein
MIGVPTARIFAQSAQSHERDARATENDHRSAQDAAWTAAKRCARGSRTAAHRRREEALFVGKVGPSLRANLAIAEQIICKRSWFAARETPKMRHVKLQPVRNRIDLADPSQVRGLKKKLHISADDLQRAVGTVGNSIAAVSKELQKTNPLTEAP